MKFNLSIDTELNTTVLKKILEKDKADTARYIKLENYYRGQHTAILSKKVSNSAAPNNKIVNPYPSYIVDTLSGYMVGEPITYSSTDENALAALVDVISYNDGAAEDMSIARDLSIYGSAYELLYIDALGDTRFIKVSARDMIIIYDDTIEQNIIYAIRKVPCYDIVNDKHYNKLEVYSAESIKYYTADEAFSTITFIEEKPHFFGDVPVVEYKNNEMEIGDYETIIPLIDAYDRLESDSLDDYDSFVDAYMILRGVNLGNSEEDMRDAVKKFQEQRVMVFPDGESSVEYLTKDSSDTIVENLKNRISADIHKFAKVPDLADKEFASNASGIAIKFKLYGTETLVANKERFFLKGLQRRIELIFNILNIKGNSYSWQDIEVQFTRNVPTNESEIADVVQKLSGTVSTETLLAQIPFVTDVGAEMEKLEGDKSRNPFYNLALETEGVSEDEEV